jgi:hypothetical protein
MTAAKKGRWPVLVFLGCCLLVLTGCGGDGPKRYPVSGQVTLDGNAIKGGSMQFVPDEAKGNTAQVTCVGKIGSDGKYELKSIAQKASESGDGAPAGWYKVFYVQLPDIHVDPKFLDVKTTPLSIEVTASPSPGQYDIKLTK